MTTANSLNTPSSTTSVQRESAQPEGAESAHTAGLRYVSDADPGLRRVKRGTGFAYINASGNKVCDTAVLDRIASLAIPPAWTDVWICASSRGHLQATGRDSRGRKQYRYHSRWRAVRDQAKFHNLIAFGQSLPLIRAQTSADIARRGLPREKVLAVVIQLLEGTLIRIGNEEYVRENHSFGLTTLRNRHVEIDGSTISFEFNGKSGKHHSVNLHDRRLARVISKLRDLPGQELFQYVDHDGNRQSIGSADVNSHLKQMTGQEFSAKDYRTWAATVLALSELESNDAVDTEAQAKSIVVAAIESVAKQLGNTPSVCRKCYVHPAIIDAYLDGSMAELHNFPSRLPARDSRRHLQPDEAAVMTILQQRHTSNAA